MLVVEIAGGILLAAVAIWIIMHFGWMLLGFWAASFALIISLKLIVDLGLFIRDRFTKAQAH